MKNTGNMTPIPFTCGSQSLFHIIVREKIILLVLKQNFLSTKFNETVISMIRLNYKL